LHAESFFPRPLKIASPLLSRLPRRLSCSGLSFRLGNAPPLRACRVRTPGLPLLPMPSRSPLFQLFDQAGFPVCTTGVFFIYTNDLFFRENWCCSSSPFSCFLCPILPKGSFFGSLILPPVPSFFFPRVIPSLWKPHPKAELSSLNLVPA